MSATVYLNGQFVSADKTHVSLDDGGVLHGAGLFETMRTEAGKVFRFESHLDRLMISAAKLLRPIERSQLPSTEAMEQLLGKNGVRDARVRLTVTAGPMREDPGAPTSPLTIFATVAPLRSRAADPVDGAVNVVVCQFRQSPTDPLAGHKTTSYLPRLLGLREAQSARCREALWFTTQNLLAEGSISNVFVVHGGVVRTPSLDTPVVPGIARGVVLELALKAGIPTKEQAITIDDLLDAEEVFLTNTIMQVMPVSRVEKKVIGSGRVGPITSRLLDDYQQLVKEECGAP